VQAHAREARGGPRLADVKGPSYGVAASVRGTRPHAGPSATVPSVPWAVILVALVVTGVLALGHLALEGGWLETGTTLPFVVRAFATAAALGIGVLSLAVEAGRRLPITLIVGVAFTGFGLLMGIRLALHLVALETGAWDAGTGMFVTRGRHSWALHMYLPVVLLLGCLLVPPHEAGGRTAVRRRWSFVAAAAGLALVGIVAPWFAWFPGRVVEGVLVARPDAGWIVAAYLLATTLFWRRRDLSESILGRWLSVALVVGFLNAALVGPFWHTVVGGAALLDSASKLLMVSLVSIGAVLGMNRLSVMQKAANDRWRHEVEERERVQAALARQAARLEAANAELAQYAYLASHDLQEPLRMVTSYLQLVERRYAPLLDDDGREFIRYAVDGAARMKRLTNDLLRYSRVSSQPIEIAAYPADDALRHALQHLEVTLRESEAEVTSDPLPTVPAQPTLLTQLFQNLIANAVKFRREDEPPRVHVRAAADDDAWRFEVRDNGIGIAPAYHDRVFDVFERLHGPDRYAGSGIGLALCRRIVERHGGRIWIDSAPGEGTSVIFTMPHDPVPLSSYAAPAADPELERQVSTLIDRARELL
jgi:signal transduction histidine kinase